MTSLTPAEPINLLLTRELNSAQIKDLWYDWFCKDTALYNKGRKLLNKLRTITPSSAFNAQTSYVFFKNNCPCDGRLYDDFRICDIATGDVLFCVIPCETYRTTPENAKSVVWGKHPRTGEHQELVRGTWTDVKRFFHGTTKEREAIADGTAAWCAFDEARRHAEAEDREREYAAYTKRCEDEDRVRTYADLYI